MFSRAGMIKKIEIKGELKLDSKMQMESNQTENWFILFAFSIPILISLRFKMVW